MMELQRLLEPFPPGDIEWRIQASGEKNGKIWARCLAYVTSRAVMNRLDEVCGPENWRNEFAPAPCGGIMCGISIRIGDEWVTKWDGAENTDIEAVKGGLSGAMKRAAVQWGVGRYLYLLDAGWADIVETGGESAKTKEGKWFRWNPPALPSWALPSGTNGAKKQPGTATEAQVKEIRLLAAESVITTVERQQFEDMITAGLTKQKATQCIDWLKTEVPNRKAQEAAEMEEANA